MSLPPLSSPAITSQTPRRTVARRLIAAFLLPLFFVVAFPLAYLSATHAPTPHEMRLTVSGPQQVVTPIVEKLGEGDAFAVTQTDAIGAAEDAVRTRTADGAIQIAPDGSHSVDGGAPAMAVTAYVAGAGGRAVTSVVQATADRVAEGLGTTAAVVDVAPLDARDPLGTNLFYLLVFTSLGGYLVIVVLMQVMPTARFRHRLLAATISAFLTPLLVFGLSSLFTGDYGADFGTIVAALAVASLYVFVCSLIALLMQQMLGSNVTFGVMALVVFLNLPSAGGAVSASLLPPFWQGVHSFWFGSAAMESFRSIVYFDGAGLGRWLLQLGLWAAIAFLLASAAELLRAYRAQHEELVSLRIEIESSSPAPVPALVAPTAALSLRDA